MNFRIFFTPSPGPPCHCHKSADFVFYICFLGTPLPVRTSYMQAPTLITFRRGPCFSTHYWPPPQNSIVSFVDRVRVRYGTDSFVIGIFDGERRTSEAWPPPGRWINRDQWSLLIRRIYNFGIKEQNNKELEALTHILVDIQKLSTDAYAYNNGRARVVLFTTTPFDLRPGWKWNWHVAAYTWCVSAIHEPLIKPRPLSLPAASLSFGGNRRFC